MRISSKALKSVMAARISYPYSDREETPINGTFYKISLRPTSAMPSNNFSAQEKTCLIVYKNRPESNKNKKRRSCVILPKGEYSEEKKKLDRHAKTRISLKALKSVMATCIS
ncbi:hypothetical protein HAX54_022224 [Datura stramonium]|uniref:Uncharacterized protein n=1 Tax=Datura stramonium TaxID=4076 RepID=A0ABS8Y5F9_DATST|nr:hypothetical protein [Datura stramonium]